MIHQVDGEWHEKKPGYIRVRSRRLAAAGRTNVACPCGCVYPIVVQNINAAVCFKPRGVATGCAQCQPIGSHAPGPLPAPPPEPTSAATEEEEEEKETEDDRGNDVIPLPSWWKEESNVRFAEVLFLLEMRPPKLDHYLFESEVLKQRFPREEVTIEDWFTAFPFLERALHDRDGTICSLFRDLSSKKRKVSVHEVDEGARRRSKREKESRKHSQGSWHSLFTDNAGNLVPALVNDDREMRFGVL
jgi:hypothetical protein